MSGVLGSVNESSYPSLLSSVEMTVIIQKALLMFSVTKIDSVRDLPTQPLEKTPEQMCPRRKQLILNTCLLSAMLFMQMHVLMDIYDPGAQKHS